MAMKRSKIWGDYVDIHLYAISSYDNHISQWPFVFHMTEEDGIGLWYQPGYPTTIDHVYILDGYSRQKFDIEWT